MKLIILATLLLIANNCGFTMENSPSGHKEIPQKAKIQNEKEKVTENTENNLNKQLDLKKITVFNGVSYNKSENSYDNNNVSYDKDSKKDDNEQAKTFSLGLNYMEDNDDNSNTDTNKISKKKKNKLNRAENLEVEQIDYAE